MCFPHCAVTYGPLCLIQVRKWIVDWNLNTDKKHTLLRLVYEALVDCKKRCTARTYILYGPEIRFVLLNLTSL